MLKPRMHYSREWSAVDLWLLRQHYATRSNDDVAALCGKTIPGVRNKAFELGLRKATAKGQRVAVGGVRVRRGIPEQKVGERRWLPVYRAAWEAENGPLPRGHALIQDGSNIELITRAELMRRNSFRNLPAPLPDLIQLKGQLTRAIHRREHEEQN